MFKKILLSLVLVVPFVIGSVSITSAHATSGGPAQVPATNHCVLAEIAAFNAVGLHASTHTYDVINEEYVACRQGDSAAFGGGFSFDPFGQGFGFFNSGCGCGSNGFSNNEPTFPNSFWFNRFEFGNGCSFSRFGCFSGFGGNGFDSDPTCPSAFTTQAQADQLDCVLDPPGN